MKKILYIYGYGGSATGSTVTMLQRLMPEGYSIESFTYTQADCAKAREEIIAYIKEHRIDLVMGSSLGGFITLTLTGVPRIVINPCWKPSEVLPMIGAPAELVATYAPFEEAIEHPSDPQLVQAYFADTDELLGDKYIERYQRCYDATHCHRIPSSHHLSEEGAKVIIKHLPRFVASDLYIQGTDAQLQAIKSMVLGLAKNIGCDTSDESALNIPMSMVMQLLTGDPMHRGLLVGMNTEDPYCVVLRIEYDGIETIYESLLECFVGLDIEVVEDVEDEPWPFE